MKPLLKLFIYCSIIALFNYAIVVDADPSNDVLMGQEPPKDAPEDVPQNPPAFRARRSVVSKQNMDQADPPQDPPAFRARRSATLEQNVEPENMRQEPPQEPPQALRQKRQMPSPDGVPPPPMPPL
ncbi:uncharacterized protein LOC142241077 isoform X1 [Haematobia irritans]|uniref:uncharacterized protein LOC142241077 isoform X1 n=1 Tax=Haematobia irritans TaxID=7368 RepID=UPI003F5038B2